MKEKVVSYYLSTGANAIQIANALKISVDEVLSCLKEDYYAIENRRLDTVIRSKQATDYYLSSDKISATQAAKQFKLTPTKFCLYLKELGIERPNKQNETKFNENIFDSINTEEKAYWLGFIWADGSIGSSPLRDDVKSRYDFELSLSEKDTSHLEMFNKFMEHKNNNVKVGKVTCTSNGNKIETKRCRWGIVNKHMWNTLNDYGCTPNKSLTLCFPNQSIFKSPDLIRHFIRGYFDGDGSVGIYGELQKVQCSCLGTKDMIDNILLHSNLEVGKYHHDSRHAENTLSFQMASHKALQFLHYIYKDATIYLDRKYEKYLQACRLLEESNKLSSTKIGEDCDVNPEVSQLVI